MDSISTLQDVATIRCQDRSLVLNCWFHRTSSRLKVGKKILFREPEMIKSSFPIWILLDLGYKNFASPDIVYERDKCEHDSFFYPRLLQNPSGSLTLMESHKTFYFEQSFNKDFIVPVTEPRFSPWLFSHQWFLLLVALHSSPFRLWSKTTVKHGCRCVQYISDDDIVDSSGLVVGVKVFVTTEWILSICNIASISNSSWAISDLVHRFPFIIFFVEWLHYTQPNAFASFYSSFSWSSQYLLFDCCFLGKNKRLTKGKKGGKKKVYVYISIQVLTIITNFYF